MTRLEMEAIINGGGVVLFNGKRYFTVEDLPTQEEIDAIYSTPDVGPVVISVDAVGTALEETNSRLPETLDADGGLKVHLMNPEDIAGGGGGVGSEVEVTNFPATQPVTGDFLTDGELRASPVPVSVPAGVSVTNLPAVQPVSDNGSSLTVDGAVSVSNLPSNYPSTVADGADVSQGSTTDAEATGNGTQIGILKRLRTLVGSVITALGAGLPAAFGSGGGVKVDIVSGGGAVTFPAPVQAFTATSRAVGTYSTADITNTGYKGIKVYWRATVASASISPQISVEEVNPANASQYEPVVSTNSITTVSQNSISAFPGNVNDTSSTASTKKNWQLGQKFRITLLQGGSLNGTTEVWYQLLP